MTKELIVKKNNTQITLMDKEDIMNALEEGIDNVDLSSIISRIETLEDELEIMKNDILS